MPMQRSKRVVWFLAFVLTAFMIHAGTTGKIAGRIQDSATGDPLFGANIVVENTALGAATDINGEYYILNIPPGRYDLTVRMIGYKAQRVEDIRVSVDLTTKMDLDLESTVLSTDEVVVVTANRMKIQKDLTSSERAIGASEIDKLPVRSINELVTLQAGVTQDASGNLHIRGGRTNEITYMVDGVQVVNPLYRSMGISIDDQAIQELKAITGTFNAEYGQALSGVVNIVTKQGSPEFQINATAYMGDYLSFDDDVYFVMDNTEWAREMARTYNRSTLYTNYDFSRDHFNSQAEVMQSVMNYDKPWLYKKPTLNVYEPWKQRDIQLNISGPVPWTSKRLSYFLSGRYQYSPGFSYGKRYFMPWGIEAPVSDTLHHFETADNAIVPLNWYEGVSTQSKIFLKATNALTLSYGLYMNLDHSYGTGYTSKYVPDGGQHDRTNRYTQILSVTYVFSKSTFLDFKGSYYINDYEGHLYDDPFDYRYMPTNAGDYEQYMFRPVKEDDIAVSTAPSDFSYWGNGVARNETHTKYTSFELALTSQITKRHLIKTGVSGRLHELSNDSYNLQFSQATYRPIIPDLISPFHTFYEAKPKEFSSYIQDKIEFNELIINIGLRFDYFDSDGRILSDPMDPQIYSPFKIDNIYTNYTPETPADDLIEATTEERLAYWYGKPEAKYQLSPRFGLSFPITETGVIHFSYGHFFQNPEFQYLYTNPNFWVTGAGAQNLVGNSDLDAERTVMYEVGLQQQLIQNLYLHVTGFYRDIRDWVGSGFPIDTYRGLTYYKYVNKDHATAKGVTLSGSYNTHSLNISLDYTVMQARGTSSDPRDAYNDIQAQRSPRVQMISLDWDQPQSLSLVANYNTHGWNLSGVGTVNSGLPYTPQFARGESTGSSATTGLRENSDRNPMTVNLDLRISKTFRITGSVQSQVFVNITNLLDTRNARAVYADTGRPDFTLDSYSYRNRFYEIGSIEEYYANPGMYTNPRFIQLGLRFSYH
ncbi:TonB-dependent receptor [bacterium]|nr:TonB-dependent receptor [bacterium]